MSEKVIEEFSAWWDEMVEGGQWTTLERLAALSAWEEQERRHRCAETAQADAEMRVADLIKACEGLSALMSVPMMLAGSSTMERNALDKMRTALSRLPVGKVGM